MKFARRALPAFLLASVSTAALAQGAPTDRVLVTGLKPAGAEPGGQALFVADDAAGALPSLGDFLERNAAGVTVSTPQGNPFQPELSYRGYSVSGLLGLPQGLAFFQNGARINEGFGDTVNFDLVPEIAVERVDVISGANPLFGLNALGGSIAATMKTGFSFEGAGLEAGLGSFGRATAGGEYGWNDGTNALYAAGSWFDEDGWRDHSPSEVVQLYADAARRFARGEIGLSVTYADSDLNGNGAAPIELLWADRDAVFTHPDNTQNELLFVQGRGDFELSDVLTLETGVYHRRFRQKTLNGDETDIDECEDPLLGGQLCMDDGEGDPVEDIFGDDIEEDDVGDEPFGMFNRSGTDTDSTGITSQIVLRPRSGPLREATFGAAYDRSDSDFASTAEIGELTDDRSVEGSGHFVGGPEFNTGLETESRYWGLYAGGAFDLTERLSVEASARYNAADIELIDQIGTALNGKHDFERFNPAIEATYDLGGAQAFVRYAESNRTPTPAELACADETQPCRFPNAFVADPPLEQVVSKGWEAGLSGSQSGIAGGGVDWAVTAFAATNHDDIIFVSSGPVIGSGYFRNAGDTRRRGLESWLRWSNESWSLSASYTYVDAEFRDAVTLRADDNPNADANGEIFVTAGDRIPLIPAHSAQFGAEWRFLPGLAANLSALAVSSRVYRGDEANDGERLPGFVRVDAGLSADVSDNLRLFARVENVLGQDYATFGTFGEADELFLSEAPNASDPRFLTPGAPRAVFVGARMTF